jgi:RNA polymerase sigma factor (sigma-70 family)
LRQKLAAYSVLNIVELALLWRKVVRLMKSEDELNPTRGSLLARLKDWDDQESWKQFFDTYWKLIYGTAIKTGLSDAEAQDVVQGTMLAVAKKMNEFKYDPALGSFKSWLLHLVRWRITDQFRKRLPTARSPGDAAEDTARTATVERVPDPASLDLNATWEEDWQKNLMDAAIARTKRKAGARQYQIFDLYAIKGWPVADIVKTLGVSADQVYQAKTRVSVLIKKEAEYLEKRMI